MFSGLLRLFATMISLSLLVGCSPTIGNRADLNQVKFEIGKTHKKEVAEALGLPAAIQKDSQADLELWGYQEKPELTGVIWPMLTDMSATSFTVTTFETMLVQQPKVFQDSALICAFDRAGVLTDLKWNK